ncbi:MAG: GDYXXLXY domain-containing protein [Opitutaceae bacterium]
MRYRLAIGAVVLQVLALAFMAGEREWILRTGRTILLRTAPIDPNDPMRGDYVRLDYEISHVPRNRLAGELPKHFPPAEDGRRSPERKVYARLDLGENGIAELADLIDTRPDGGIFIRGRAQNSHGRTVQVRYGIEALFMEQGSARKLENMRTSERAGVPLDIEVALSPSGIAVLKDYTWEPLGITLSFERTPAPPRNDGGASGTVRPQQLITSVTVELKNYGTEDLAVVDLPNGGSLRLVPDERWQDARFRWVGEERASPRPEAGHVFVLKPGEGHKMKIDLTAPAWFVVSTAPAGDKTPVALRDITDAWSASFRIEYAPPPKAGVAGLPHAELIRHGRLRSRAFNPTGSVD